ncbi:MAG: hypothetical protein ACRD03_16725, partial [Acidimicrobiales bacterium]
PPGAASASVSPVAVSPDLAAASGSVPAAAAWLGLAALSATAVWGAGRRYRRLVAYPLGAPVVGIVLFGAFDRVAALLPAAV